MRVVTLRVATCEHCNFEAGVQERINEGAAHRACAGESDVLDGGHVGFLY